YTFDRIKTKNWWAVQDLNLRPLAREAYSAVVLIGSKILGFCGNFSEFSEPTENMIPCFIFIRTTPPSDKSVKAKRLPFTTKIRLLGNYSACIDKRKHSRLKFTDYCTSC
ncbi:MAG: hypothetical protein ACK4I8_11480, partial [Armatimonadota bacterium]